MMHPVTVLITLLSVEFVLYTVCLCVPQWFVHEEEGISKGLFALCNNFEGFASCITFPAWVGTYSLSWMFLAGSSVLSFAALFSVQPALSRGRRAIASLILNICSVTLCECAVITFLVSIEKQMPHMLKYLGWAFYICCATLLYAMVVSVLIGLMDGSVPDDPTIPQTGAELPVTS